MQIFKIFQYQKTTGSKIQKSLIRTNIKKILLAVMAINYCVDDKFSQTFNTYSGKSKYCCYVMKKHFKKELVMTKEDKDN